MHRNFSNCVQVTTSSQLLINRPSTLKCTNNKTWCSIGQTPLKQIHHWRPLFNSNTQIEGHCRRRTTFRGKVPHQPAFQACAQVTTLMRLRRAMTYKWLNMSTTSLNNPNTCNRCCTVLKSQCLKPLCSQFNNNNSSSSNSNRIRFSNFSSSPNRISSKR